jgi:polysaccharide biosynthesis protein VpsQ
MKKIGFLILAALAILALIAIILLADQGRLPDFITSLYAFPDGDKVGHFCLMGAVSFCVNLGLSGRRIFFRGMRLPLGSLLVALAITLEECSQLRFPARTFDLLDLSASLLGIGLLGEAACLFIKRIVPALRKIQGFNRE